MNDTIYRLTIEDQDPTWSEWHLDRLPDVHGMPAGTGHYWTDRTGRYVEGYEDGGTCGGCGWDPTHPEILPPDQGPIVATLHYAGTSSTWRGTVVRAEAPKTR